MPKLRNPLVPLHLALIFSLLPLWCAHAEFSISEFLADNSGTTFSDEDGFPADWIEIQNPDATAASVLGYYLTDDPDNLSKWALPDVTIGANGYLVVFTSGKDRAVAGQELHTNFSLGAGGEFLALVKPDGQTIVSSFSPEFPGQLRDISYGISTLSVADFFLFGAALTYHVPEADIGDSWQDPGFDDSTWTPAHTPVGWGYNTGGGNDAFDIAPDGNLTVPMKGENTTIYLRIPFQLSDPAEVLKMTLKTKVDDGFVAFLNGFQVAAYNEADPLIYTAMAPLRGEVSDAEDYDLFPLDFAGKLVPGENILAIHGLNDSLFSSDFVVIPELVGEVQDLSGAPQPGYFEEPTPGSANGIVSSAPPQLVDFSVSSQAFTATFDLALSVTTPGAVIRYTDDGTKPVHEGASPSPEYSGPLTIDSTTLIRAAAFLPGAIDGPGRTEGYFKLGADRANFSSDLPVILLSSFGKGSPPTSEATTRKDVFMLIYEPDPITSRTTLSGTPSLATRGGYRKRGSSSGGFPKYPMSLESWDESDEDKDIEPLGFGAEGDWILNSRFQFDLSLMRNTFLYELSNQAGRWAVKTRFVELFNDVNGGDITGDDYFGVYTFMEKIEPDKNRLDISDLDPWEDALPKLTGGYVFRKDVGTASINVTSMGGMVVNDPDPLTTNQKAYLEDYLNEMDVGLGRADGTNPTTMKHFSEYLDVSSFVDNFWFNILSMNADWGARSQYFFKDRGGLLQAGPIWDYDRSMGARDFDDDNPEVWDWSAGHSDTFYDSEYPWYGRLFGFSSNNQPTPGASSTRPDVFQQVIDRWYELRGSEFSQANMEAIIDSMAAEMTEAQARNFVRWTTYTPGDIQGMSYAAPGTSGWEREVSHLKGWLLARSEWIDDQFFGPPVFNQGGGVVAENFQLTMSSTDATVYYTLDGSDPRAPGGAAASAGASAYSSALTLTETTVVTARAWDGQQWGSPTSAAFVIAAELADSSNQVISEIMYHPADPSAAEISAGYNDDDFFEFIEIRNISGVDIVLHGLRLSKGVDVDLVGTLTPGESGVVVADLGAFQMRYGTGQKIIAEWEAGDKLDNGGEMIRMRDGNNDIVREFTYDDVPDWPTSPDGSGYSLVLVDPFSQPDHNDPFSWRPSAAIDGNAGTTDSTTFGGGDNTALLNYATTGVLPTTITLPDGTLSVTVHLNQFAEDIEGALEMSTDLITWFPADPLLTRSNVTETSGGFANVTFTAAPPLADPVLFVRYTVQLR
jgi:hypothetical protein